MVTENTNVQGNGEGTQGNGTDPESAPQNANTNSVPQTPTPPAPNEQGTQESVEGNGGDDNSIDQFPEEAQRMIRDLRNENARSRVQSRDQAAQAAREEARTELVKEFGKLLGYESEGEGDQAPSVEDLSSQLTQERDTSKSAILELEIYKAAGSENLDPNALLDSRNFMRQVENLDPSGKDFKDSLTSILKDAAKDTRFVAPGQVPPRSTSEHPSRKTSKDGENLSRAELAQQVHDRIGFQF